jgi:putative tricarboxylic transport membrane protein
VRKINAGIIAGLVILIYSCVIFWLSFDYDYYTNLGPGPGLLPMWLSGALIVLSILYMFECVRKEVVLVKDILPKGRELGGVLTALGVILLFMIIVNTTGFVIACTLLLFLLLVREFKWYWGLGISAGASILLFIVFYTLLGVPLPVNAFGW